MDISHILNKEEYMYHLSYPPIEKNTVKVSVLTMQQCAVDRSIFLSKELKSFVGNIRVLITSSRFVVMFQITQKLLTQVKTMIMYLRIKCSNLNPFYQQSCFHYNLNLFLQTDNTSENTPKSLYLDNTVYIKG